MGGQRPHTLITFTRCPGGLIPLLCMDLLGPPSLTLSNPLPPSGNGPRSSPLAPASLSHADLTPTGPISHLCPLVPSSWCPKWTASGPGVQTSFTHLPCQPCPCLPVPKAPSPNGLQLGPRLYEPPAPSSESLGAQYFICKVETRAPTSCSSDDSVRCCLASVLHSAWPRGNAPRCQLLM